MIALFRDNPILLGLFLMLGLLGAGAVWMQQEQADAAREMRGQALADCRGRHAEDWCEQRIAEFHDKCFVHNHQLQGNRYSGGGTEILSDQPGYNACIEKGYPDWLEERRETKRAQQRFRNEHLP